MLIVTDVLRDDSKRKQIKAKKYCTRLFVHHDKNYWSLWLQVCRHTPQCSMSGFTNIMHWRLWSEEGVAVDNLTPNFVQSKGKKKKEREKSIQLNKVIWKSKNIYSSVKSLLMRGPENLLRTKQYFRTQTKLYQAMMIWQ